MRASDELVAAWIEDMTGLADTTRHTRVVGVHRVLTTVAPQRPQPLLRNYCRRFEFLARRQVRKGKIGRVPPTADLLRAGLDWLGQAKGGAVYDAIRFRDGLMVAALALMPIRIGNFQRLEIGRSFLPAAGGYHVHLRPEETKSGRSFEATVARELVPHFDRYLLDIRPMLAARSGVPHSFLWVTHQGAAYRPDKLGRQIASVTQKMIGIAVHPHLFRDAAATTIARSAPAQARAIRGVLGHATSRTADRHYNQARTLDAARSYASLLDGILDEEKVMTNERPARHPLA